MVLQWSGFIGVMQVQSCAADLLSHAAINLSFDVHWFPLIGNCLSSVDREAKINGLKSWIDRSSPHALLVATDYLCTCPYQQKKTINIATWYHPHPPSLNLKPPKRPARKPKPTQRHAKAQRPMTKKQIASNEPPLPDFPTSAHNPSNTSTLIPPQHPPRAPAPHPPTTYPPPSPSPSATATSTSPSTSSPRCPSSSRHQQ